MARQLHRIALVLSLGLYACVVPPPLQGDIDAGVNTPPVIVSVHGPDGKELAQTTPGAPVTVARNEGDATITVFEADTTDDILVQGFVDYLESDPTGPRSSCTSKGSSATSTDRTLTSCTMAALCTAADTATGNLHYLVFEVYDRPIANKAPLFRTVDPPGRKSSVGFVMRCIDSTP